MLAAWTASPTHADLRPTPTAIRSPSHHIMAIRPERPGFDVLVRYGPVVYWRRLAEPDEFEVNVQRMLRRYPDMSRELAEQQLNQQISECDNFWKGEERPASLNDVPPDEASLQPAPDAGETALVVAWLIVLAVGVGRIGYLCTAPTMLALADPTVMRSTTEALLEVPADSLNALSLTSVAR